MGDYIFSIAIFSAATTFLLQIATFSQSMALVPLFLILLAIIFRGGKVRPIWLKLTVIDFIVLIYFFLFGVKIIFLVFSEPSIFLIASIVVSYVTPGFFYYYVRRFIDRERMGIVLKPLIFAGLFSAAFLMYDLISRLLLHSIPWFSSLTYDYSKAMMGYDDAQMNVTRIVLMARPMGIMVSHSHSATWIVIGFLSLIAYLRGKHFFTVLLSVVFILILGMNYSSLVAFVFVVLVSFPAGILLFRNGNVCVNWIKLTTVIVTAISIIVFFYFFFSNIGSVGDRILMTLYEQTRFIFFEGTSVSHSFFELTIENTKSYINNNEISLISWLFGAIPTALSAWKIGGDTGYLDSIFFLGFPLWFIVMLAIINFQLNARYKTKRGMGTSRFSYFIEFPELFLAGAILIFLVVMDIHYNVWLNKSVQIALFSVMGLCSFYDTPARIDYV
jgi:hypothetical protein